MCVFLPGLWLQGDDFPNIAETHIWLEQNKYKQIELKFTLTLCHKTAIILAFSIRTHL